MKRALCLGLVLAMLCALLTFMPAAAATIIDSGSCGGDLTWELDADGTLTISGFGEMNDMSGYGRTPAWNEHISDIKKVILPEELTYIGSGAFEGCVNLSEVNLPDTLEEISAGAFEGCSKLKNMNIPQSLTKIGLSAFEGTPLISQRGDFRFLGDDILVEYTGSGEEVIIPDGVRVVADEIFLQESQEWPGSYEHNQKITKLVFPDSVKYIGETLAGCKNLADIKFPSGLISIENQRFDVNGSISWYDNQPVGVVYIGDIAYHYKGEESPEVGEIVPDVVEIKEGTRVICSEFFGFYALHPGADKVILPDSVERIESVAFRDSEVNLPKNLKYIGGGAFQRCHITPENVDIPDGVTKIGDNAFSACSGIKSVNIPDSVTYIGAGAFNGNSDLTKVEMPETMKRIGAGAFSGCHGLTGINIPNSVTNIGSGAFSSCGSLNITVGADNPNYCDLDGVLFNKDKTEILAYAKDNLQPEYTVPNGVVNIADSAFNGCGGLKNVIIPNSVTRVGASAFRDCAELTSVNIPDRVRDIGDMAFFECDNLTKINIPNGITSIEYGTFDSCENLKSISIPSSVSVIDDYAFYFCRSLSDIYYGGTESEWNGIEIIGTQNNALRNATIHYNASGLPDEPSATNEPATSSEPTETPKPTPTSRPSYGGGGGGGGGSFGTSGSTTTPKSTNTPDTKATAAPVATAAPEATIKPEAPATVPVANAQIFDDVPADHWAYSYITELYEMGIISGETPTMFVPDDNVTRAEFAKMASLLFGLTAQSGASRFADIEADEWYAPYVIAVTDAGIVNGTSETTFGPNDNITREQITAIIGRQMGWASENASSYSDAAEIEDYALPYVTGLSELGILTGENGMYRPKDNATRAEAAAIIARVKNH